MRIPHVHQYRLDPTSKEKPTKENIRVHIEPQEYIDDIGLFEDKKEFAKWVLRMKKNIHHSYEYEELMWFLKHKHGLSHCGIHPNISVYNGFQIEIHHTPFTITDIITIVTKKRMDRNESLKMTDINREIMELHYLGVIGLYPLCQLCHPLAHAEDNELFIPLNSTFGDADKFVDIYHDYMTDTMKTKWDNIVVLNKGYSLIEQELPLSVRAKYIYIETEDGSFSNQISTTKLTNFIRDLNSN